MSETRSTGDARPDTEGAPERDPFLRFEEVADEEVLDWVRARNAETIERFAGRPRFEELRTRLREVLDDDTRIPYVRRRGPHLYNFWRDADHPRGLWRRTTLDEYRKPDPDWEVLIDLDALAEAESENWVWQGATVLRPEHRRCLVELSRGGADAAVVREFDLDRREFVPDGFVLPEAKSSVSWIDADHVWVGTDFGPDSVTTSGYPRLVKLWRRGTPLEQAELVFEGASDDVAVRAHHDPTEGWERDLVRRSIDFYRSELYLRTDAGLVRVDVPEDAVASVHRQWLLVRTRSPWTVGGVRYPAGALLAAVLDDFLAGEREMTVLFRPDPHTSLDHYAWTRNHLLVTTLRDVRTRLRVLTPGADGWRDEPLPGVPEFGTVGLIDTDPDDSDEFVLEATGFTDPPALLRGEVGTGEIERLKQAPAFFDTDGLAVDQHVAVSADGTEVPYFLVSRPGRGPAPTLLTGYGGFEVSLTPSYSGVVGRGWLERGGNYVVANLRGGGEYGPDWHNQAVKADRPRVYEDFAAVAADLVERGVTTPGRLGVQGGSNGGLLTGVMLTRYPERVGAVVSQVPLLDMERYHLLLAGASWMAEYGDPDDPADWETLRRYSPYHNLDRDTIYPPALFVTSTRDDRVHPAHARKMVARMREQGHDVTYYENIEGGHGAAADNAQLAFKWALVFDFLWQRLTGDAEEGDAEQPRG
ncbi:prolyl oligopeptidase family serine peptidase [Saccharomonospora saliphila]|uniref:prolyl oligopeptidase family serine peptidase n=1 Tax=Saccharomonospora saliphila TaxID=369829 RepID=UPI00035E6018|nr:prolyl oligopeptidase family serine peptidase [Saccharomonospora saliphila]